MLLFAANDPGAKNKIRPVYEHALGLGYKARFIDLAITRELRELADAREYTERQEPTAAILGCSANQGEWALIRACKVVGVPTGMVVDIGTLTKIDSMTSEDFPSRFMVSNQLCHDEVTGLGADPNTVSVTGDCDLEALSNFVNIDESKPVREHYGLDEDSPVISFFCSPITQDAIDAIASLAELIPTTGVDRPALIVRPHPRTPHLETLEMVCQPYPFMHFDAQGHISNRSLLSASVFSLSMASTVTVESLVLGIPSAFFQVDWDYTEQDRLYRNLVDVVRIRTEKQLNDFVESVARKEGPAMIGNVENHRGALARTWQVVEELMASRLAS